MTDSYIKKLFHQKQYPNQCKKNAITFSTAPSEHWGCRGQIPNMHPFGGTNFHSSLARRPTLDSTRGAFTHDVRCFLGIFDLPTYSNQILYKISLFSKICSLIYLGNALGWVERVHAPHIFGTSPFAPADFEASTGCNSDIWKKVQVNISCTYICSTETNYISAESPWSQL